MVAKVITRAGGSPLRSVWTSIAALKGPSCAGALKVTLIECMALGWSGTGAVVNSGLPGRTDSSLNGWLERTRIVRWTICPGFRLPRLITVGETITLDWTTAETETGIFGLLGSLVSSVISSLKKPTGAEGLSVADI